MISIDDSLQRAIDLRSSWSRDRAYDAASSLAGTLEGVIDWDEGAGEEWMRIITGNRLEVLISVKVPLAFVSLRASRQVSLEEELELVVVENFDEVQFSCSTEKLNEAFGWTRKMEVLNPASFSVNDIWYATV